VVAARLTAPDRDRTSVPGGFAPLARGHPSSVRLVLNVIWLVLSGLWLAIGYAVAALICFICIVTIPFGIAALRIAAYALWPFGATVVKRADAGVAAGIGNVIWVLLCGWWLALAHLVTGVALCLTIIGIPLGLANFKLVPVAFLPLGREIVSVEEAEALRGMPA
jgi:uncharacterized membrane protein YccF (DUF307 family)